MYDQVYWMLTFGDTRHVDPVSLRPEMAPYTDLRGRHLARRSRPRACAWAGSSGPPDLIASMNNFLGHVGAWAPRAEQVATAKLLDDA